MCPEINERKTNVPYDREFFFNIMNTIKPFSISNAVK